MFADNSNNGMYMPVAPAFGGYGGGGFGGGMGFGGDWAWILLLLVLGGGWGGFGMGGGMWPMMMGMGGFGMDFLYPWLNNSEHISDGFRDQQLQTSVSSIGDRMSAGFGDVQLGISGLGRQICETGNAVSGAVRDGFYGAEVAAQGRHNALTGQLYQGEINALNRSFQEQTANAQGFNGVQSSLCDIRYGNANNTRDIIESQNRGTQAILDKLCQLELDGVKNQVAAEQRENANLRTQLSAAQFAASQADQTAQLRTAAATIANQAIAEIRACPIPSQPVYGNTPIFQCAGPQWNNSGCGCGGNGFMN